MSEIEIERAVNVLIRARTGLSQVTVGGDRISSHLEVAIAALCEIAERERGCEYCGDGRKQHISLMCYGGRKPKYYDPIPLHSFCPMCGKRLEVEHGN